MTVKRSAISTGVKLLAGLTAATAGIGFAHENFNYALLAMPVAEVLGHLFTHLSSDLVPKVYEDIASLRKSPTELNHDLRQMFLDALTEALEPGIVQLYHEPVADVKPKAELSKEAIQQLTELSETFNAVLTVTATDEEEANKLSGGELTNEKLIELLDEKNEKAFEVLFDLLDDEHFPDNYFTPDVFPPDFLPFFKRHFIPLIQLFFTQRLKDERYSKGRAAFEQMMAQETYRSLKDLRKELSEIKNEPVQRQFKIPEAQRMEVIRVIDTVTGPKQLNGLVHQGLENYLVQFDKKLNALIALGAETNSRVKNLKVVAAETQYTTKQVKDIASQNLKWTVVGVLILFVIMALLAQPLWPYVKNMFDNGVSEQVNPKDSTKNDKNKPVPPADTGAAKTRQTKPNSSQQVDKAATPPPFRPVEPSAKLNCNVEGLTFRPSTSWKDHITFTGQTSSRVTFTGQIGFHVLKGVMRTHGNELIIMPGGSASGTLLLKDCKQLSGDLFYQQDPPDRVDMTPEAP